MNVISEVISIMGSQQKVADACGVRQSAVAAWLRRGGIPAVYCADIEKATEGQITRKQLRPTDWQRIWPELAVQQPVGQGV